jgi:hypothetical protein
MAMDFLTSDASFEEKVIYALSEMNTKIEGLVGNGQPGRISDHRKSFSRSQNSPRPRGRQECSGCFYLGNHRRDSRFDYCRYSKEALDG